MRLREKVPDNSFSHDLLVSKCREKSIGVMGPVIPPTRENLENAIHNGYNMIILGNDMWHFQKALRDLMENEIQPLRKDLSR